jgi:hypothetical protein
MAITSPGIERWACTRSIRRTAKNPAKTIFIHTFLVLHYPGRALSDQLHAR